MNTNDRINIFDKITKGFVDEDFKQYLIDNGYFTAPASTKYHGNYEGGLFDHCLMVANELMELSVNNKLKWDRACSPVLIGLFHDLCKIDNYVKTDEFDTTYEYNKDTFLTGHGDKSVMMLASNLKLTEEEVYCIRYHMGAFTEKEEWKYFTKSLDKYPNVLWTHHADMLASQVLGV